MANVILPPVPSVARFAVTGTWQGQPWTNIFHGQYSNVPADGITMNSICQAVHTAYVNAWTTTVSPSFILNTVTGQDLASRTGAVGTFTLAHAGTGAATPEPPVSVALCCSWTIQDRYRGGHPRTYMAGLMSQDLVNNRTLTTAAHTRWFNNASAFLTDFNAMTAGASSWKLVCVRYFSGKVLLPNPYVRPISAAVVHQRVDSMRRRLGKEVP